MIFWINNLKVKNNFLAIKMTQVFYKLILNCFSNFQLNINKLEMRANHKCTAELKKN